MCLSLRPPLLSCSGNLGKVQTSGCHPSSQARVLLLVGLLEPRLVAVVITADGPTSRLCSE